MSDGRRKRREHIYGLHAVASFLSATPERAVRLYVDEGRDDRRVTALMATADASGVSVQRMSRHKLDELALMGRHQGVVAEVRLAPAPGDDSLWQLLDTLDEPPLLLMLDGVKDPHNLGACLRTADAAGAHAVIAPRDKAVGLTPVVYTVASGAASAGRFFQVTNLARVLRQLQERGVWIVGTAEDGQGSLFQTDLTGPLALVMGAEETGLRRLTRCPFPGGLMKSVERNDLRGRLFDRPTGDVQVRPPMGRKDAPGRFKFLRHLLGIGVSRPLSLLEVPHPGPPELDQTVRILGQTDDQGPV